MAKNYRAELVAVFGDPVDDNPTGAIEEAAFAALGLNYRYLTVRVLPEALGAAIAGARAFHMKGFNLTMPHKIRVIPFLDGLTDAARLIGAVNTVYLENDRLIGEKTDGKGFVEALISEGVDLTGKQITLLGAGGAARAIGVECALAGAKRVDVINRNRERGLELSRLISSKTSAQSSYLPWEGTAKIPEGTQILINGTCVGLAPNGHERPDIDYQAIAEGMVVADVVFNPENPPFLREAAARGAKTITGLGMLACQAARNFTLWTGEKAPLELMKDALRAEFAQ